MLDIPNILECFCVCGGGEGGGKQLMLRQSLRSKINNERVPSGISDLPFVQNTDDQHSGSHLDKLK